MASIMEHLTTYMAPKSYDLLRLFHHPMFSDLQATLKKDVSQASIPYSLVDRSLAGDMQTSQTQLPPAKMNMVVEDASLQAEFRQLASLSNPKISELEMFYQTQSASIVTQRADAILDLQTSFSGAPEQFSTKISEINALYDSQQSHLTGRINTSLQLVKASLPVGVAPPGGRSKKSRTRMLSSAAVDMMKEWYESHIDNPYPSDDEKASLADRGGISVAQVKAWFANKRNRTLNTRPKRQMYRLQKQVVTNHCASLGLDADSGPGGPMRGADVAYLIDEISDLISFNPTGHQKVINPAADQNALNPTVDQKSFNPAMGQHSFNTTVDQKAFRQIVELNTFTSTMDQNSCNPTVDQKSLSPTVNQISLSPKMDQDSFSPKVDSDYFNPAVNQRSFIPTMDQNSFSPTVDQNSFSPAVDQDSLSPTMDQHVPETFQTPTFDDVVSAY